MVYAISSVWVYKKNSAILNAGKIKPTIGTKIDGKKAAAICIYDLNFYFSTKSVLKISIINCIWKYIIIKNYRKDKSNFSVVLY